MTNRLQPWVKAQLDFTRDVLMEYLAWHWPQVRVRVARLHNQNPAARCANVASVYILVSVWFVVIKLTVAVHLCPVINTAHAPNIVAKLSFVFKHP